MQVVTARLSERVGHLIDVAEARAATSQAVEAAALRRAAEPPVVPVEPTPAPDTQVAQALGEMAMLLNNIELRGLRGPRPPPDGQPRPPRFGGNGRRSSDGTDAGRRGEPPQATGSTSPPRPGNEPPTDARGPGARPTPPDRRQRPRPEADGAPAAPAVTSVGEQPATDAAPADGASGA